MADDSRAQTTVTSYTSHILIERDYKRQKEQQIENKGMRTEKRLKLTRRSIRIYNITMGISFLLRCITSDSSRNVSARTLPRP